MPCAVNKTVNQPENLYTANCGVLATSNFKRMRTWVRKTSIGEVLLTFLALYAITQLFWIVKFFRSPIEIKSVSYGLLKVAIVINVRMRLTFKVARTPQFAVQRFSG